MNDKYQEVISQTISWNLKAQTYREIITLNSDGIDFAHIFAVSRIGWRYFAIIRKYIISK